MIVHISVYMATATQGFRVLHVDKDSEPVEILFLTHIDQRSIYSRNSLIRGGPCPSVGHIIGCNFVWFDTEMTQL